MNRIIIADEVVGVAAEPDLQRVAWLAEVLFEGSVEGALGELADAGGTLSSGNG